MLKEPTSSFVNSQHPTRGDAAISVQCVLRNIQKCFLPTKLASASPLVERWSNQFPKMRLELELELAISATILATVFILKIWGVSEILRIGDANETLKVTNRNG